MGKVCTIEVDEDVVAGEAFGGENRATQVGICEVGLREVYGCVAIRAIGRDNRATQVGFGEVRGCSVILVVALPWSLSAA